MILGFCSGVLVGSSLSNKPTVESIVTNNCPTCPSCTVNCKDSNKEIVDAFNSCSAIITEYIDKLRACETSHNSCEKDALDLKSSLEYYKLRDCSCGNQTGYSD